MKKILPAVAAFIALFVLAACQTLTSVLQEPVLSLQSVEIAGISLNGAQVLCKIEVENPNGFDIPFPETDWEFFVNANSFVKGTVKNNHKIKARNKTVVDVPVDLKYLEILNTFQSLVGGKLVYYKIALGLKFPIPVIRDKVWTFEHADSLPFPQPPRVRAPSMRMENANTTRAEISVTVNVENPNPFDIPVPKIEYDYQLNRNTFIKGNLENEGVLAAGKVTPVTFKLVVTYADLFRSFSSLLNQYQVNSLLVVTCDFGNPLLGSAPQRFEVPGTLPVLR